MPKAKPAPAPTPRMTVEEWNAEGIRRFGENQFLWKFVCPMCGNVQSAEDFRPYKDRGATPNSANQVCIGRYRSEPAYKAFGKNRKGSPKSPCDYALFGLLRIPGVIVVHPDGHEQLAFAFADANPKTTETP